MSPRRSRRSSAASSSPAIRNDDATGASACADRHLARVSDDVAVSLTPIRDVSFLGADALMGATASSSGAPGGYPPPPANGTTLEAALAQIEEEQLQKVRAPPRPRPARGSEFDDAGDGEEMPTPPSRGFVRSRLDPSPPEPDLTPRDPPFRPRQALAESRSDSPDAPRPLPARPRPPPGGAVELGVVESDEAMAQRLQREERERANASSRDAFYPNMPYDPARRAPPTSEPQPASFLMPVPHHAPHPAPALSFSYPPPPPAAAPPLPTAESLGRRAMNDEIARNTGEPRGTWTAPVLHGGSYPREPASPYYPPVPTRGGESPGGESPGGDGDAALAARLQAEEDAAAAARRPRDGGDVIDDDEALARALQEEEDLAGGRGQSTNPATRRPRRMTPADSVPPGACPGCRRDVSAFGGYVTAMGARWHRGCFACGACGGAIGGTHFATRDGAPYHRSCYRERFAPRCGVCDRFIGSSTAGGTAGGGGGTPANDANEAVGGSVRFMTHPYWGTVFCPEHEFDGTRRCDGCDRMEARGGRGVATGGYGSYASSSGAGAGASSSCGEFAELPDGRAMCLECASTAVIDAEHDGAPLYDDVCVFFSKRDLPLLPERPPLHLVSQDTLNDADDKEGWHRGRTARTRGLCLFEEHTVYTVERTPDFAGGFFPVGFKERVVGQSRGATVVNAVVVLYGLPAVCAGAILAHECTHAYIRMAGGYPRLRPKIEEGLCQLMALLWVENTAGRFFRRGRGRGRGEGRGEGRVVVARQGRGRLGGAQPGGHGGVCGEPDQDGPDGGVRGRAAGRVGGVPKTRPRRGLRAREANRGAAAVSVSRASAQASRDAIKSPGS